MVEANLQRQVDAVKARYQQEQSALDLSTASEATQIAKSTQLLTDALTQQTTLRRQATTDTLKLIDDESKARVQPLPSQGQTEAERSANVTRVENEILATKRQTHGAGRHRVPAHIDALNAEANRHLAEIQRIEEAKRQLTMTHGGTKSAKCAAQGMTEFEATEDRKRQVAELQTKARDALANGEFEQARQLAQKAMDLAAQVASTQTTEAKKAEEARKQSEQAILPGRETGGAVARGLPQTGVRRRPQDLMRQADQLRAELAQKTKDSDAQIAQGKEGVNQAIQDIRESEEILNKALDAEAKAHQSAAQSAVAARDQIKQTLTDTETQIDQITAKLKDGSKVTLDADTTRFDKAIADLDKALAREGATAAHQGRSGAGPKAVAGVRGFAQGGQDAAGGCRCDPGQGSAGQAHHLRQGELAARAAGHHRKGPGLHHQRRGHDQCAGSHPAPSPNTA